MACDRLPYELVVCPTCGAGVKFSRGFTWLDWLKYAGAHEGCKEETPVITSGTLDIGNPCPVCHPGFYPRPYGLLWVGQDYTPETFVQEALQMGVSKRIAAIPRNLKLGETWVLFATKKAIAVAELVPGSEDLRPENFQYTEFKPAVFYAFRPQRLELLIWESEATEEKLAELEKKHITPVVIPDGDVDHDPRTPLKPTDSDKDTIFFDNLRNQLGSIRERVQGGQ